MSTVYKITKRLIWHPYRIIKRWTQTKNNHININDEIDDNLTTSKMSVKKTKKG